MVQEVDWTLVNEARQFDVQQLVLRSTEGQFGPWKDDTLDTAIVAAVGIARRFGVEQLVLHSTEDHFDHSMEDYFDPWKDDTLPAWMDSPLLPWS